MNSAFLGLIIGIVFIILFAIAITIILIHTDISNYKNNNRVKLMVTVFCTILGILAVLLRDNTEYKWFSVISSAFFIAGQLIFLHLARSILQQ